MRLAAQDLHQYGPQYILIKGGHTAEASGYSAKVGHAAGLPGGLEEDARTGASAAARGISPGEPRRLPARGGPGGGRRLRLFQNKPPNATRAAGT